MNDTIENAALADVPSTGWLAAGFYCCRCGETGRYRRDSTTPLRAFRIDFDSCAACDPHGEDSFRYYDREGNHLSLLDSANTEVSNPAPKK